MQHARKSFPTLFLLAALTACGDGPTSPDPGPERTLALVGQAPASAVVGEEVPLTVVVREDGRPVEGVEVRWELLGGGGSVEPGAGETDSEGRAGALWRIGTSAGAGTLRVRADAADPLLHEIEARAGPAADVEPTADSIRLTAYGERARAPLRFEDVHGNPAEPPAGATWEIEDPDVAGVDAAGELLARARGETTVHLDSPVGSGSARVVVAPRGVITVTFDDGFRSVHSRAFPVIEALGFPANVAVVTQSVDESWDDFLHMEHLEELHDAGWAVVSHTVTHDSLPVLNDERLEAELADSRAWIEDHGFRGAGVFVVPYHAWDDRVRAAVEEHYEMARGISAVQFFPDTLVRWMPDEPHALTALEPEHTPMSTEAGREEIRGFLERAVDEGLFIELFFHDITEEMLDDFTLTMEIVAEFSDDVVPYDEVLERFRASHRADAPAPVALVPAPVAPPPDAGTRGPGDPGLPHPRGTPLRHAPPAPRGSLRRARRSPAARRTPGRSSSHGDCSAERPEPRTPPEPENERWRTSCPA